MVKHLRDLDSFTQKMLEQYRVPCLTYIQLSQQHKYHFKLWTNFTPPVHVYILYYYTAV